MARGYGAFTVDESSFDRVFQYIKEQKEHHAGLSSLKVRRLVSNSFQDSVSNHKPHLKRGYVYFLLLIVFEPVYVFDRLMASIKKPMLQE